MTARRFTYLTSVLFGAFGLSAAVYAIPLAIQHAGHAGADGVRFTTILLAILIGLAFFFPRKLSRLARDTARHTNIGPIRFAFAVALVPPALVAMISGGFPRWLTLPLIAAYLIAFVMPGLVLRNLDVLSSDELTSAEVGALSGQFLKKNPRLRKVVLFAILLFCAAICAALFVRQSIPNPTWAALAGWLAFAAAIAVTAVISYPAAKAIPIKARARTLPREILFAVAILAFATLGFRGTFRDALPVGLAIVTGEAVTKAYRVLSAEPDENRKNCLTSVNIETPAGQLELCGLPRNFVAKLSPGQVIEIDGIDTLFGHTIEHIRIQ